MENGRWVGRSIRRTSDEALLRGQGQFLDDLVFPAQLHARFIRSPLAHARIKDFDATAALRTPGVVGVYTARDLSSEPLPPFLWDSISPTIAETVRPLIRPSHPPLLPSERVVYTGQAFAILLAENPYTAEDAAESIDVEYDPLPVVASVDNALASRPIVINDDWGDNVAVRLQIRTGSPEAAFRDADLVIQETFSIQRQAGVPLETRGAAASWDQGTKRLTLWSSTQNVHPLKRALQRVSGLQSEDIRVVAPHVGGGFGTKGVLYPEDLIVGLLALKLGRPIKWTEGRLEHMQSAIHARDQVHRIELALSRDGAIAGLKDQITVDCGAYNPLGIVIPYNTVAHLLGPYRIENMEVEAVGVITNKVPNAPYRGAGRPEAVFALERAIEIGARRLGIDPVEMRQRNLVRAEDMPYEVGVLYRDGQPIVLDSGDYSTTLSRAQELVEGTAASQKRTEARRRGLKVGTGFACYVEGTGIGPFEGASIAIRNDGITEVKTGASSQGQGHETILAQICAERMGIGIGSVEVITGDTDSIERGWGTVASRTAVVAGNAVAEAADALLAKCLKRGASELGVAIEHVELSDQNVQHRHQASRSISLGLLASRSKDGGEPLEATFYYAPPTVTWSHGAHAVSVGVDRETGEVEILDYVVVHDCGVVVNPSLVEGQLQGAVAQGIGGALYEELVYDENAQLLNGSFAGYVVPTSMEIPSVTLMHLVSPSPLNPLGIKGMGEGGTVAPPAAIANAVENALAEHDVVIRRTPLQPCYLFELLDQTEQSGLPAD